jgi:glutathione synthase/RimK-type ligase-like ATP-grasp enzyme
LEELRRAGERAGFYVELITTHHINRIAEFDALLIRATTRVNHPTYEAARRAHAEGLVVIDDPWSILRCSNKVYLYERLARARVRQPRSWLFYRGEAWRERHPQLSFPLVLKRPEGSFSTGVFKVASADELDAQLEAQWGEGELLIGQEFLPTAFDWRVGVLEHEPLFACQYFMAPGHWQIYQWSGAPVVEGRPSPLAGDARGVPLSEVPPAVLSAAVRAASLMGEGLYGVDLKVVGEHVYVIEVNDNPNLDRGVEDEVEGVRLYQRVIDALMSKIERAREVEVMRRGPLPH